MEYDSGKNADKCNYQRKKYLKVCRQHSRKDIKNINSQKI